MECQIEHKLTAHITPIGHLRPRDDFDFWMSTLLSKMSLVLSIEN
jgi:hypothetical protein